MTESDHAENSESAFDGAHRGRRISWAELYRQRPDLKSNSENRKAADEAA